MAMGSNWEGMLKRWSVEQGTRRRPFEGDPFDHPAMSDGTHRPAPKWRGRAQKLFAEHPPHPIYDIADRVSDIALALRLPPTKTKSESESESESEDEVEKKKEGGEDEVEKKKEGGEDEVEKKKEGEDESDFESDFESDVESEDASEDASSDASEDASEDASSDELKWIRDSYDELQAYVESVDVARVLHIDNLLSKFLRYVLSDSHVPGIRAKGAELVTTMVQNNPTSQQLVIKEKGLQLLFHNFTTDPDATSRTKALGAISSLIRSNNPGIAAFRLDDGYAKLRDALSTDTECVMFQREALNLIQYLLHENSSDCNIVTELGLPHIMMHLASNDDLEVREAALRGLLILARDEGGNSDQLVKNDDKLKQVLQARIEGISAMAPEYLAAAREERQLVDSLWNACYNEPSSLGGKGLLVLPGEDAPAPDVASKLVEPSPCAAAPDVASKLFEPSLRSCTAAQAVDRSSVSEKKDCNIVTELGLPRIMIHLASSDDAEVREAALRGLLVLARDEGGNSGQLVKNDDKLKQVLQARIEGISAMAPEYIGATREEMQLVDSLWNACYNVPSSLGEKGLLVLPGEEAPLLLGLGPPSAVTPTVQSDSSSKRRKLH